MNAVDKLDFQETPEQTHGNMANRYRKSLLPGLHEEEPNITDTTTVNKAGIHTSRPEPCSFSVSQAGLVPTPNNECRPKVNPLRCHTNVTEFAEQLVDTSEVSMPPMVTSTPRIEITKAVVEDLESAPIYSPSSGNLSQYARQTPSASRSAASSFHATPLLTPGNVHEIPYYTPTRPLGRSTAADYAASQRGREMTVCDSNPQLFPDYEQARLKENQGSAKPVDAAKKSKMRAKEVGRNAMSIESPKAQRKPLASDMHGQKPGYGAEERKETLKLSPYRVGNSKRIIGWVPLPSSPVFRYATPIQITCDHASDEDLASIKWKSSCTWPGPA